jgi:hypothetical protein
MKIREDMKSIYVGEMSTKENGFGIGRKENDAKSGSNIFAGKLRDDSDVLAVKKQQAQTKAYRIVSDANKSEVNIDNTVDNRKQHISDLEASSAQNLKTIKDYKDSIEELNEKYGVTQENLISDPTEPKKDELSDYEKEIQPYEQALEKLSQDVKNAQDTIDNERMTLNAIALSRLKEHGMVDAQKASDTVLEAASKDIVGTLIQAAVDQVEENINDMQEKQDKIEEKQDKIQEEKIKSEEKDKNEEIKADEKEKQQSVDTKQESNNHLDVLKQLNKVLVEEKLMDEDLKGIILDEQI